MANWRKLKLLEFQRITPLVMGHGDNPDKRPRKVALPFNDAVLEVDSEEETIYNIQHLSFLQKIGVSSERQDLAKFPGCDSPPNVLAPAVGFDS